MNDFRTRMKEELDALSEKIAKLFAFLGSDVYRRLGERDRELLNLQLQHMLAYRFVLSERLAIYNNRMGDAE